MTVGEFKAQFSNVIELVKKGEEIAVTFGKKEGKRRILYSKSNGFQKNLVLISKDVNMPPYIHEGLQLLW